MPIKGRSQQYYHLDFIFSGGHVVFMQIRKYHNLFFQLHTHLESDIFTINYL